MPSFQAAMVTEAHCIGCTKCLPACPTGALVGATKAIHTVLTALCTGCGDCVPLCPAACLTLVPVAAKAVPLQTDAAACAAATDAHTARKAALNAKGRPQATAKAVLAPAITALPQDLVALAAAAREKSAQKYARKGPLRPPKALAK